MDFYEMIIVVLWDNYIVGVTKEDPCHPMRQIHCWTTVEGSLNALIGRSASSNTMNNKKDVTQRKTFTNHQRHDHKI